MPSSKRLNSSFYAMLPLKVLVLLTSQRLRRFAKVFICVVWNGETVPHNTNKNLCEAPKALRGQQN